MGTVSKLGYNSTHTHTHAQSALCNSASLSCISSSSLHWGGLWSAWLNFASSFSSSFVLHFGRQRPPEKTCYQLNVSVNVLMFKQENSDDFLFTDKWWKWVLDMFVTHFLHAGYFVVKLLSHENIQRNWGHLQHIKGGMCSHQDTLRLWRCQQQLKWSSHICIVSVPHAACISTHIHTNKQTHTSPPPPPPPQCLTTPVLRYLCLTHNVRSIMVTLE